MVKQLLIAAAMVVGFAAGAVAEDAAPASRPATRHAATTSRPAPVPADKPSPRMGAHNAPDAKWMARHDEYVALAKKGNVDLYFLGDSITDNWHTRGKEVWAKEFAGWNAANFGIGGDQTQHVLWRLENGELDGVKPKAFVMMIGTNNIGRYTNAQVVAGNTAIVEELERTHPTAKILLLGIFPRGAAADNPDRQRIKDINAELAKLDDGKNVKYLDIGPKFLAKDGSITREMMNDSLHPTAGGYQIWADAIKPVLTKWLGAPEKK